MSSVHHERTGNLEVEFGGRDPGAGSGGAFKTTANVPTDAGASISLMSQPILKRFRSRTPRERRFVPHRFGGNYLPLVGWILVLYLLAPTVIGSSDWAGVLVGLLLLTTVALGLRGATDNREALGSGGLFLAAIWLLIAVGTIIDSKLVISVGLASVAAALFAVQIAIVQDIVPQTRVTVDTIFGSIGTYLVMLFMWTCVYAVLSTIDADSFSGTSDQVFGFLYFSTVTQTTVGYGDITPLTEIARSLAGLQALVGQLYVAILVAWIVGRAVSQVKP